LIALAKNCSDIEQKKVEKEAHESFNESIAKTPDLPEDEKKRIWATFYQPRFNMQVDYTKIITEYFNKVFIYRDRVLPKLRDMINAHEIFNERFHVKSLTLYAIKLFLYVFFLSVVTPLILLNFKDDLGLNWYPAYSGQNEHPFRSNLNTDSG